MVFQGNDLFPPVLGEKGLHVQIAAGVYEVCHGRHLRNHPEPAATNRSYLKKLQAAYGGFAAQVGNAADLRPEQHFVSCSKVGLVTPGGKGLLYPRG